MYHEPTININKDITPITFNVLNVDNTDFYENLDSIKLIKLETNDESLIGQINQLFIVNDTLFVVDYHKAKSIFVFDLNGNYLHKINHLGNGPGEYQNINMAHINRTHITISDWLSSKIIKYDLKGNLLSENRVTPNPNDFIELENREMLFAFTSYTINTPHQVVFADTALNTKETAFPFKKNSKIAASNGISSFQKKDNTIMYYYSFCDTIYQIKGNEITAKYNLALYDASKRNAFLEEIQNMDIKKFNNKLMNSDIVGNYMFLELDDIIYLSFSRAMTMYVSIIYKENYSIYNSIAGDGKKIFAYNPFIVSGYCQNALLAFIDESFFSMLSNENRDFFYSHISDKENIEILKELENTDNNPVVCVLYIKKNR